MAPERPLVIVKQIKHKHYSDGALDKYSLFEQKVRSACLKTAKEINRTLYDGSKSYNSPLRIKRILFYPICHAKGKRTRIIKNL